MKNATPGEVRHTEVLQLDRAATSIITQEVKNEQFI